MLATSRSEPALLVRDDTVEADVNGFGRSVLRRQESVEEMTLLLDEMIRQKIESGHAVDGLRGRREALLQDYVPPPEPLVFAARNSGGGR